MRNDFDEKCTILVYSYIKESKLYMALTKNNYKTRLIDEKIENYLKIFGSICKSQSGVERLELL